MGTFGAPMPPQSETTFEVWVENTRGRRLVSGGLRERFAIQEVVDMNADEAERARMELRPVRERFYVVEVVTTRREHVPATGQEG